MKVCCWFLFYGFLIHSISISREGKSDEEPDDNDKHYSRLHSKDSELHNTSTSLTPLSKTNHSSGCNDPGCGKNLQKDGI